MERRTFLKLAALVPGLALAGCGGSKTLLSPKDPTMLSIWHVYGEQADSPMNRLLTEFNDTVGREKGILLNVTNMTNSAAIGGQLQDAKAGKPGALNLPDLFSAHPADASALGIENLVDWNDWFTAEDMAAYVPGFVQDGIIEGRQVVFPVSKSTQLIFLNGSQYARFAADTGAQLSTLATWDGFFEMAGAYRQWSQGKPFCALDYPLRLVELNALEQGSGKLYKGSWYDLTNETFRASWMEFARALVQGDILISDLYSNTQVMTGETLAGLGSSAAILYYNDFVTYPDNTTEPTDLLLAPLPHAAGTATPLMPQAGVACAPLRPPTRKPKPPPCSCAGSPNSSAIWNLLPIPATCRCPAPPLTPLRTIPLSSRAISGCTTSTTKCASRTPPCPNRASWGTTPRPKPCTTACASARRTTPSALRTAKRWKPLPRKHGSCCVTMPEPAAQPERRDFDALC